MVWLNKLKLYMFGILVSGIMVYIDFRLIVYFVLVIYIFSILYEIKL